MSIILFDMLPPFKYVNGTQRQIKLPAFVFPLTYLRYLLIYALCYKWNSIWFCLDWLLFTKTCLRYVQVFVVANPSIVCRAPYSGGWTFRQYFFATVYLSHPLISCKILRRSFEGNPSVGSVKRKRGSKIQRCHVRVSLSHLLVSFLYCSLFVNCFEWSVLCNRTTVPTWTLVGI